MEVTKLEGLAAAPEEAASKPHHVLARNGSISKFKNPHPSFGPGAPGLSMIFKVLGYVISPTYLGTCSMLTTTLL